MIRVIIWYSNWEKRVRLLSQYPTKCRNFADQEDCTVCVTVSSFCFGVQPVERSVDACSEEGNEMVSLFISIFTTIQSTIASTFFDSGEMISWQNFSVVVWSNDNDFGFFDILLEVLRNRGCKESIQKLSAGVIFSRRQNGCLSLFDSSGFSSRANNYIWFKLLSNIHDGRTGFAFKHNSSYI